MSNVCWCGRPECPEVTMDRARCMADRRFSRAEVEALLAKQREACAAIVEDADDGVPLQCLADGIRATPLVTDQEET